MLDGVASTWNINNNTARIIAATYQASTTPVKCIFWKNDLISLTGIISLTAYILSQFIGNSELLSPIGRTVGPTLRYRTIAAPWVSKGPFLSLRVSSPCDSQIFPHGKSEQMGREMFKMTLKDQYQFSE